MIHKSNNHRLVALLTSLICFSVNVGQALSAEGSEPQPTTAESSTSSAPLQSASALTATPATFIQSGTRSSASMSSSAGSINQSGCNGTCIYAFLRTSPTNNNGLTNHQVEGVIGVMHVFNSPDQTNAETNRQMMDIQRRRSEAEIDIQRQRSEAEIDIQRQRSEAEIFDNYIKQISDACQARDFMRAELYAGRLARISGDDYKTLLEQYCSLSARQRG